MPAAGAGASAPSTRSPSEDAADDDDDDGANRRRTHHAVIAPTSATISRPVTTTALRGAKSPNAPSARSTIPVAAISVANPLASPYALITVAASASTAVAAPQLI